MTMDEIITAVEKLSGSTVNWTYWPSHRRAATDLIWSVYPNNLHLHDGVFMSTISGSGDTPEQAVQALWTGICNVPEGQFLMVGNRITDNNSTCYRWDGQKFLPLEASAYLVQFAEQES